VRRIASLENKHLGEDIFVVGGGRTVDYYPRDAFQGRTIIAVNQAGRKVDATYTVRKENATAGEGVPVIASRHVAGMPGSGENRADYVFDHNANLLDKINTEGCHPYGEKLIVSWSTITSAIHLAAFMGAGSVFLVGHDCAVLDGGATFKGYYDGVDALTSPGDYAAWLSKIGGQTAFMRDYLRDRYQANLFTLSPFIGLKHEGHEIE